MEHSFLGIFRKGLDFFDSRLKISHYVFKSQTNATLFKSQWYISSVKNKGSTARLNSVDKNRKRNVIKVFQSHHMWSVKKRRARPLGEGSAKRKRLILGRNYFLIPGFLLPRYIFYKWLNADELFLFLLEVEGRLREKLRVVKDLFFERGCFLPARVQSAKETEAGTGGFLLAWSLLEVNARATRVDEWRRICFLSEVAFFQLGSNLQKRLKLAEVAFCQRGLFLRCRPVF
jgi:hypothetical protein